MLLQAKSNIYNWCHVKYKIINRLMCIYLLVLFKFFLKKACIIIIIKNSIKSIYDVFFISNTDNIGT